MSAQLYNIGPNAIADQGVKGGPGFTLSRTEWTAIQTYTTDALALPTTDDTFRKSLGNGAPKDLTDFAGLIQAYKSISKHVTTWTTTTFPAAVDLASDVYQYGSTKAPVYYPPILKEAKILEQNPKDEDAKAALKAILDNLKHDAVLKADKAGAVAKEIGQFAADTEADRITLVGANGKAGLVKYYDDKYGTTSDELAILIKDIDEQRVILKTANDEYNYDVTVAATSPTYAWVWPWGTIAAAVVAGVYGKRATDALDRGRAAQAKIATMAAKMAADANLLMAIHSAELGMSAIVREVAEALPVIQKIQGVWGGIAADLGALSSMVDNDIRNVPPIIMDLGVDEAIRAWHDVAENADSFRVHADVKDSPDTVSMAAWKVATQFASTRAAAA